MRPIDLQRMIQRRAFVFGGLQAFACTSLLTRLYYLQFVRGEEYVTEAEGNRIKVQMLVPPRGVIADRYGVAMAMNHVNYRLMLESERKDIAAETLEQLGSLLQLRPAELEERRVDIKRAKRGFPVLVREHLSWEEMARVEFHLPNLPTAFIEEGQWRHYPFSDHASHLIGYVGKVAPNEVKEDDPLLKQPDMRIGKNGIEALYEAKLRGIPGTRQLEVNVVGSPVRELAKKEAKAGPTLNLTIDTRLQEYVVERLADQSGAVVVMHVHTGEVLALASVPSYDPNEFSKGIKQGYWNALNANEKVPLLNKAIAGQYPPGSTFKMVTGLAALKSGKVSPERKVYCPGHFYLGSNRWNCWKPEGHGAVNFAEALAVSCDTYFYTVGREAGIDAVAEMAKEFGLGAPSGLGLRGERAGIVPSPDWKKQARGLPWNPGETINTAIGQGDVLTTPVQLAIMTARMVNGGKKIYPRLLLDEESRDDGFIDIDAKHLQVALEGMNMVTNSPRGTAYGSTIKAEGMSFGGKTGTAQVRRITVRGQDQNSIPWKFRHHGLFVGFAPAEKPEYCCSVLIEHGGGGASAAAPVARDVMQKLQELLQGAAPRPLLPVKDDA
ncbi:MAG: penicillin-binding protein 2 [Azospirillum brasilense]|nr:MAG: penicillin-binding protein 2 [Azospirillum brasilense]